jgi:hypothetical protein
LKPDFTTKGVAMKATMPWLGALVLAVLAGSSAHAQAPYYYGCRPQAPDACGPCYFCTNACGQVYGPNYCVRPPFSPYSGIPPFSPQFNNNNNNNQIPGFPVHPFVRSPRDYFMVEW